MEIVGVLASYINVDRIFLYLILLILFFGLAIVIERTIFFSRCKVDGTALLSSIHQALQSDNLEKAIAECNLSAAPLSHIFRKGLTQAIPPVLQLPPLDFDEPTANLDPQHQLGLIELVASLVEKGISVFDGAARDPSR